VGRADKYKEIIEYKDNMMMKEKRGL